MSIMFSGGRVSGTSARSKGSKFVRDLRSGVLRPHVCSLVGRRDHGRGASDLVTSNNSLLFRGQLRRVISGRFRGEKLRLLAFSTRLRFSGTIHRGVSDHGRIGAGVSMLSRRVTRRGGHGRLRRLGARRTVVRSHKLAGRVLCGRFVSG